ncbi:MAG: DUF2780 domain-containing protein [Burkholderiales bacterium]|uniref:DUF2780 domain-containing protein n=1 Tax=Nitrosomonas sp. TaxID=42353 RepID=UPI001D59AB1B|nr:DUF2780 domain-containing protein [Nitrosomonas sp.]MCB1947787.1 DUF2780 domain-containing protein [Nitrosomonas sp.]MCP5243515.1 DUF2780 domain-containing protein [Burkholderiales bacterium]
MKNRNYTTLTVASIASLTLTLAGCASSGGGNNTLSAIDSGLTSVEQSAQAGRQAIETGTTAATEMTNQANTAIASGAAAATGMTGMAGTSAGQVSLVNILTQQLGISQQQALGGAGAIFQAAQAGMNPQAFSSLSQSVPGINEMLNAAPVVSSPLGGMGSGVSSMLGGAGSTLNNAASLAASFQQLNLSPDMVGQFIPIVTNYVQNTSGQVTANLLRSALGAP